MKSNRTVSFPDKERPLWLMPGVILVILQWMIRFAMPALFPGTIAYGLFGGVLLGLAIIIWWTFFSRATKTERFSALPLMIVFLGATHLFLDKSISTAMMGMMFWLYSIPVLCLALVLWAVVSRNTVGRIRFLSMVLTLVVASGFWTFLRTKGMTGEANQFFTWRWAETAEEKLLAEDKTPSVLTTPSSVIISNQNAWTGFRGPDRDNVIHGIKINPDWKKYPPEIMWRKAVGPGCSSFTVSGNMLYTQEQRGNEEMVTCYDLGSGKPQWRHNDSTRFWDSHAGAGPRSTPFLNNGRIYSLGATGIFNVLNAYDGSLIWTHNAANDTGVKLPGWGYSGSPLVVDSVVIVPVAGKLIAYDAATGNKEWTSPDGGESYSSPHLITNNDIKQVLFSSRDNLSSFLPADGRLLWRMPFINIQTQIVQPAVVNQRDILISAGDSKGIKRISVENNSGKWSSKELWTSEGIKPYFNDFVVNKGYAFGFDGPTLACIDISNGERKWKGGRYAGEILLLADQDLLVVLSEKGDLALVKASPDQFTELAHFPGIKGKTWNHPVLIGNTLVIRNSEEMAALRLNQIN